MHAGSSNDAIVAQWRLAARALGLPDAQPHALHAHLFGEPNSTYSFYRSYGGLCSAARNGTALLYLRVYKSGNEALCSALRAIDDGSYPPRLEFLGSGGGVDRDPSNPRGTSGAAADRVHAALSALRAEHNRHRAIVFTCVREPLSRFAAGFSELNLFKATKEASRDQEASRRGAPAPTESDAESGSRRAGGVLESDTPRLRDFQTSRAYAERFVHRVIAGGLDLSRVLNAHILPQAAFLARPGVWRDPRAAGLPGRACCEGDIDLVGSLDDLAGLWSELGRRVARVARVGASSFDWPAMHARPSTHPVTNATAGFLPRMRMEELLRDSPPHAVAVCRVLLPDFVCFGYALPPACQRAVGSAHGVSCGLAELPPRLASATRDEPELTRLDSPERGGGGHGQPRARRELDSR